MARLSNVTGLKGIVSKLNLSNKKIQAQFVRGLKTAGLFLQRESQKIVPVHLGNLKNSAFTRAIKLSFGFDVILGYTAAYAIFVHEKLEAANGAAFNKKYAAERASATTSQQKIYFALRGEDQQSKFLEKPFREKRAQIFEIIRRISTL